MRLVIVKVLMPFCFHFIMKFPPHLKRLLTKCNNPYLTIPKTYSVIFNPSSDLSFFKFLTHSVCVQYEVSNHNLGNRLFKIIYSHPPDTVLSRIILLIGVLSISSSICSSLTIISDSLSILS